MSTPIFQRLIWIHGPDAVANLERAANLLATYRTGCPFTRRISLCVGVAMQLSSQSRSVVLDTHHSSPRFHVEPFLLRLLEHPGAFAPVAPADLIILAPAPPRYALIQSALTELIPTT